MPWGSLWPLWGQFKQESGTKPFPATHRSRQSREARYDTKENPRTHFTDDSLQPWLPLHADQNGPV